MRLLAVPISFYLLFYGRPAILRIISERVGDPLRIQGIKDSSQKPENYKE